MPRQTLTVSQSGQEKIREAIKNKQWEVSEKDTRPLVAACLKYIDQYQASHQLSDNDRKWLQDFEQIFRIEGEQNQTKEEKKAKLAKIKQEIIKTSGYTLIEKIKDLINSNEIFVQNISWGTWNRFASKSRRQPVNETAFKIYCEILGLLNWREIAENSPNQPKLEENKITNSNDLSNDSNNIVYYYLPSPNYTKLIGRENELSSLLEQLSLDKNFYKIIITGIGGIGKTSLALEAAYYCLKCSLEKLDKNYQYETIIFTSFKQQEITNQSKIIPCEHKQLSCLKILNSIARTLNRKELLQLDFYSYVDEIKHLLKNHQTLLILDNLETVEDLDNIIYFLNQLPNTVKVVITSREEKGFCQVNISLNTLNKSALELIQYESALHLQNKNIILTPEQFLQVYEKTCQIPLAIILVIGQLASYYHFDYVIESLSNGSNDIVRYCFESSVRPLKGRSSYQLLTTLALFSKIPSNEIVFKIANVVDEAQKMKAFPELQQLRLIQGFPDRYEMLSIIRSYVLTELKNDFEWESELRNRWVNWYKEFVRQYGGQDEKEWNNYEQLEEEWENITDVITWCINYNKYNDVKYFWLWIKGYSFIQGYQSDRLTVWNTRLYWTDWLIENAEKNQDYSTASEVLFDRAWTLTVMGEPEKMCQAVKLYRQAWRYRKPDNNPIFKVSLAIHIGYLRFRQHKINKAKHWLNYAEKFLRNYQLNKDNSLHQFFKLNYYRGQIYFEEKDYISAKESFEQALKLSEKTKHSRGIYLSKRWLANVAIELNDFEDAQGIFEENLRIAEENKDRVGVAFCRQSLAFLGKARGDFSKAKEFGEKAIEDFQVLNLFQEVETTKELLSDLDKKQ